MPTPTPAQTPPPSSGILGVADQPSYHAYPEPNFPVSQLPGCGGKFTDPTFGTTLLRVTCEADGDSNYHAYAYWPVFNMNSTRVYVMHTGLGPTLYDFNPDTMTLSNKRPAFTNGGGNAETATWSWVNPDLIYLEDTNLHLYSYNVATNVRTLVKDFTPYFPAGHHTWQMHNNYKDDDVFGFTWKDANYATVGGFVWKRSTNQLWQFGNDPGADEVHPTKDGRYFELDGFGQGHNVIQNKYYDLASCGVASTAADGTKIMNTVSCTHTDLLDDGPNDPSAQGPYWGPGHGDACSGVRIGADNWNNRILAHPMSNLNTFLTLVQMPDWSLDAHGSCLGDDESVMVWSPYNGIGGAVQNYALQNEIIVAANDGSGKIWHIAHHHSNIPPDGAVNGGESYWSVPKVSASKDGRFAAFTSNWGTTTRKDVFIVRLRNAVASVQPWSSGSTPPPAPPPAPAPAPTPSPTPTPTPTPSPTPGATYPVFARPSTSSTWYLSRWFVSATGVWVTQPVLIYKGAAYTVTTPQQGEAMLRQLFNFGMTGPLQTFIDQFKGIYRYFLNAPTPVPAG